MGKNRREDYGIDAMRKKRLTFVHKKAKMLRDYAKVCIKEGVNSERVNLGPKQNSNIKEKSHIIQKRKVDGKESKASLIKLYKEVSVSKQQQDNKRIDEDQNKPILTNKPLGGKNRKERFRRHKKTGQPMLGLQSKSLLDKIKASVNGES